MDWCDGSVCLAGNRSSMRIGVRSILGLNCRDMVVVMGCFWESKRAARVRDSFSESSPRSTLIVLKTSVCCAKRSRRHSDDRRSGEGWYPAWASVESVGRRYLSRKLSSECMASRRAGSTDSST